jgi:hypothetical protein
MSRVPSPCLVSGFAWLELSADMNSSLDMENFCLPSLKSRGPSSLLTHHMRFKVHCNPHEIARNDIFSALGRGAFKKSLKYQRMD